MITTRVVASTVLLAALAGCSSGPAPTLYLLDTAERSLARPASEQRVGLAEVTLPAYARKEAIATLTGEREVVYDEAHRWASPPSEAISVALAQSLERSLGQTVVLQPYPRGVSPALQLRIAFDRLLNNQGQVAEMQGQYLMVSRSNNETVHIERFRIAVPIAEPGYNGFMAAVSDGVDQLSQQIAGNISRVAVNP